jgi:hypothetical protein
VPISSDATISLTLHAALKLMKNGHLPWICECRPDR